MSFCPHCSNERSEVSGRVAHTFARFADVWGYDVFNSTNSEWGRRDS
jgi:hypothetical protein